MAEKKRGVGCLMAVGFALLLVGGGLWVKKRLGALEREISVEWAALEAFDAEKTAKAVSEELGFAYPVSEPSISLESITAQVASVVKKEADAKFPPSVFARQVGGIVSKYKTAKMGDKVHFILNTTGKETSGTFWGCFADFRGRCVKVDSHEYRLDDIMEDYQYLFDRALAEKRGAADVARARNALSAKRRAFVESREKELGDKLRARSGYAEVDGVWRSKLDIVRAKVEKARKRHEVALERERKSIVERNKLLGVFSLSPPDDAK
jgi:hypothetical protein